MAENSAISWTTHTFNPWWGCTKVSPACDHCYAEAFDRRVGGAHWGPGVPRRLVKDWSAPRKWNREAERTGVRPRVFTASMADVFDNEVPPEWRERLFDLIRETPHLDWLIVTKRIGNVRKMVPADWPAAFPHVVLLITVSDQAEANRDVWKLLQTPAARRGLSIEPMLGPVGLRGLHINNNDGGILDALAGTITDERPDGSAGTSYWRALDWVIVGGESGHGARPMHPGWARSLRDQCAKAGVPFHFKQWGEWSADALLYTDARTGERPPRKFKVGKEAAGRVLDGTEHNAGPRAVA